MTQKSLVKIQRFSTNDFIGFLRNNGYDEYEQVLIGKGIDDGDKFLNLHEMQLVNFGFPPAKRKKLLLFLAQIKENPEKYLPNIGTEIHAAPIKRTSHRMQNVFTEELEQMIIRPALRKRTVSSTPKPTNKLSETQEKQKSKPKYDNFRKLCCFSEQPNTKPEHTETYKVEHNQDCENAYLKLLSDVRNDPFFRNTDRKGARRLLQELEDGAFLFRPSRQFFLSLTLKHNSGFHNVGIENTKNNKIVLMADESGDASPEFSSLSKLVDYITGNFFTYQRDNNMHQCWLRPVLTSNHSV